MKITGKDSHYLYVPATSVCALYIHVICLLRPQRHFYIRAEFWQQLEGCDQGVHTRACTRRKIVRRPPHCLPTEASQLKGVIAGKLGTVYA